MTLPLHWSLFCFQLASVLAISWNGPSPTLIASEASRISIILATPEPQQEHELLKRDFPSALCGWIGANPTLTYGCADSSLTCFFNTRLSAIGCGNTDFLAFITSCVPYQSLGDCDSSCSANPSIVRCTNSQAPRCVTPIIGINYTAINCDIPGNYSTYDVNLTYTGQPTLVSLPRFLGVDGTVTYGTQTPAGLELPNSTTSMSSTSSTSASPSSSSSSPSTSSTPTSPPAPSSTNVGAIAGGVVGGLAVIAIAATLITWLVLRSRKRTQSTGPQSAWPQDKPELAGTQRFANNPAELHHDRFPARELDGRWVVPPSSHELQ